MPSTLTRAQAEWFSRPADQRFESIDELKCALAMRRECSQTTELDLRAITANAEGGSLTLQVAGTRVEPTHWSFSQLCQRIAAPASYLRSLSSDLASRCINEGRARIGETIRRFLVSTRFADARIPILRALTSAKYGRIWDAEVVEMAEELVTSTGGRFRNPPDWSGRPSGLYAGDRDVFLFFIDGGSIVDGGSERDQLHRGFYLWNSEVGAAQFGFATFFHRGVCGNHLIMGAEDVTELSFRHTKGAPRRFFDEAKVALEAHVSLPLQGIEEMIQRAKRFLVPADSREKAIAWTENQGFSRETASSAYDTAVAEEGRCLTLWDLVNGLTAVAKKIPNIDSRVSLERTAGRLLSPAVLEG